MKILITHGYTMSGTGSNLYVNNLVTEMCKAGHEIYLVCQEYFPEQFDFISEIYEFSGHNQEIRLTNSKKTSYKGNCKYLWTKGLHLIIFAIPFILKKYPNTKFIFTGFGPFRETAELILNYLSQNRLEPLISLIQNQASLFKNSDGKPIPLLEDCLVNHKEKIQTSLDAVSDKILDSIIFTGIIDHGSLRYLVPCADVLIAPSVFPEAFGMVAIEALSAGVFPIVTYQSAFKEIADLIPQEFNDQKFSLRLVHLNDEAFLKIADNVIAVFQFFHYLKTENKIEEYKNSLREIAVNNFSWTGVKDRYVGFYKN